MKNKTSIYIIVGISIFVGLLHFIIGPDYNGPYKDFIRGYLIDILLPMNLYLLFQISLRKKISKNNSRIIGGIITFLLGLTIELMQRYDINIFGSTYDFLDIIMYAIGVGLGVLIDLLIIDKLEKRSKI